MQRFEVSGAVRPL